MSVVSVTEDWKQRRTEKTAAGRKHTESYIVHCDAISDGTVAAANAVGIPGIYEAHPDDGVAIVRRITARPWDEETMLRFAVDVEYETATGSGSEEEDPLDDPDQITWGHTYVTEVLEKDKDGVTILNSAGDKFDPPVEQERPVQYLQIVRNETSFNPATALDYINTVNDNSVTIAGYAAAARVAKLVEFSATKRQRSGVDYWQVTYRIEFNEGTHDREILDSGLHVTSGDPAVAKIEALDKKRILVDGEPAEEPQLLDGVGALLALNADPVYLPDLRTYAEKNFSTLGLPIS